MAFELADREGGLERPVKQVLPAKPDDILSFEIQSEQESYLEMGLQVFATIDPVTLRHYARTLMVDWKPIGVIGVSPQWEGVAWGWAFLGVEARKWPLFITRTARTMIEKAHQHLSLRRMHVSVNVDHTNALDWAEILHFKVEGIMKKYGPGGEDCYMMARVWDERT